MQLRRAAAPPRCTAAPLCAALLRALRLCTRDVVQVHDEVVLAPLVNEAVHEAGVHPDGQLRHVEDLQVRAELAALLEGVRHPARLGLGPPLLVAEDHDLEERGAGVHDELPRLLLPLLELDARGERPLRHEVVREDELREARADPLARGLDAEDERVDGHAEDGEKEEQVAAPHLAQDDDHLQQVDARHERVEQRVRRVDVLLALHRHEDPRLRLGQLVLLREGGRRLLLAQRALVLLLARQQARERREQRDGVRVVVLHLRLAHERLQPRPHLRARHGQRGVLHPGLLPAAHANNNQVY